MTCLKGQNLDTFLTVGDLGKILNEDLHNKSVDWNRLLINVKQKYANNGQTPPNDLATKPDTIYPDFITKNSGADGFFNKLYNFLNNYKKATAGVSNIRNFIRNTIPDRSPADFTLIEFEELYNANPQLQALDTFGVKEALESINNLANDPRNGLSSDCSKPQEIEKKLEQLYIDAASQYIYGSYFSESGTFSGESIGYKDFYNAYGDAEAQRALEEKAKTIQGQEDAALGDLKGLFADKAIYQEQCFLLSQLTSLIALKKKKPHSTTPLCPSSLYCQRHF